MVAPGSVVPKPIQREPFQVAICPAACVPASMPGRASSRVCITVGSCLPGSSRVGNLIMPGHKLSAKSNTQYWTPYFSKYWQSPPGTGVLPAPQNHTETLTVGITCNAGSLRCCSKFLWTFQQLFYFFWFSHCYCYLYPFTLITLTWEIQPAKQGVMPGTYCHK